MAEFETNPEQSSCSDWTFAVTYQVWLVETSPSRQLRLRMTYQK